MHRELSISELPEPDLFIRTGGEKRVSNFLLWQLAYTELYFTDTLWPDFDRTAFEGALASYATRQRRFGRTGDQVATAQSVSDRPSPRRASRRAIPAPSRLPRRAPATSQDPRPLRAGVRARAERAHRRRSAMPMVVVAGVLVLPTRSGSPSCSGFSRLIGAWEWAELVGHRRPVAGPSPRGTSAPTGRRRLLAARRRGSG